MNIHYTKKTQFWRSLALVWLLVCGLAPLRGYAQQFTIGTGTTSNTAGDFTPITPYGNFWEGLRGQFMYRATELSAAGMAGGMLITDIAFNVTNANASLPHQNFKIWIGQTTNTNLATWRPTSSLTQVHGPVTVNPATGWLNYTFTAPFVWDGTSNIVIQTIFNNNTNTTSDGGTEWNVNMSTQQTTGLPASTSRVFRGDALDEATLLNDINFTAVSTVRPNARFTAIPPTPCAGAVTGGTAVASPVNFCNSQSTSLSVTGGTGLATGLTYQWQFNNSTTGGMWTDIAGATSASLAVSPTVSVTTQFRRKITCTNSGTEDFSDPATFTNVGGSTPYASLPYIQDFENWVDACFPKDIPGVNWRNTPVASPISAHNPNLSWRRQDQGSTAPNGGWTNPTNNLGNGNMLPRVLNNGASSGDGVACFHMGGFPTTGNIGGQQGWLDLYVNMNSEYKKEVRFFYRNRQQFVYVPPVPGADRQWMPVHADQLEVLLSTDGGLTFPTTLGVFGSETPDSIPPAPIPSAFSQSIVRNNWKKIAVKMGNITPTAVIRFRATTSAFLPLPIAGGIQSDIGIDDVQVVELKPCDGTPIAGTIFGNPRLCEPGTVSFNVIGSADLLGGQDYSFQWETSTDGVTWIPITGATLPEYTTPVLSTEPYYRRRITCENGGAVSYTPAVQVKQVRPLHAPVTPGLGGRYIQLFNSWIDGCQDKQLPDQHWKNTPTIGNRSWRNTADVPSNVGKWFIGFAAPANSIAAQEGTGAAAFFSRGAVGAGDLNLHVNLSASSNRKAVQLYYSNAGGTDNVGVALSSNGGTTFGANLLTLRGPTNPAWAKSGAFITSNSATAVIRFRGQSGGPPLETNDQGLDSLVVIDLVPCSTTPIGGEASASPANFCMASEISISVQKGSDDPAWARDDLHTFQWQVSTDNGATWTDITGATGGTYTLTAEPQPQVPPKQYRRKIICPNGNLEAFSTVVTLEFPYTVAYAKIPYYNGFETTWATGGSGPTCSGGNTPTQTAIRPTSPTVNTTTTPSIFNDAANIAVPARNQHWRSTAANNASTWRRTPPAPTGWTTTGNWNSYARNFPIETASASFNGFGGSGTRKGNLDLYVDASGTQMKQVRFKYRNPQRPTTFGTAYPLSAYNDDNLEVSLSFNNGKAFGQRLNLSIAPSWLPYYINFDNDAPQAVVRFTGNSFSTIDQNNVPEGTDMAIDELYVVYVNDCSTASTLQGGAAKLRETNTFPGTDFNFCHFPPYAIYVDRVNAATQVTDETHYGFAYQWQVSEDGGATYSDMAGETNQNLFLLSARVGKFRRKMTCTATGNSVTSVEVETAFTNPVVYATLPYRQGFESWQTGCAALPTASNDRPDQHWKNTPFNGQTSWRKQDEGRLANWSFNFPEGLPKPVSGVGAATFHTVFVNGTGVNAPQPPFGALDLYVNCAVPGTKQLRFWYNNPNIPNSITGNGNNDKLEILYSIDGGANFSSLGELTRQDGWQEYTYNFESTSGSTVIRFLGYWSPDDSDIGIDEVKVDALVPCAGLPDGGITKTSTTSGNTCTTLSLVLFVEPTNPSFVTTGFTYQWESSFDGITWNPITIDGTNAIYVAAPLVTTHYRRVSKCIASGETVTSQPFIYYIAFTPEYGTMPFKEDFERWGDACDAKDIPIPASNKIHWRTRPFTGDNAWRRTGEEGTGGWRDVNEPGWLQGGRVIPALGVGAASFHSYSATNRTTGDLDLFLNTVTATDDVKLLQFDYSNPDYPANVPGFTNQDFLEVYLSIDGGFSFGATPIAVYDRTKELWETKRIVFDNVEQPYLNAQYVVVRFRANSDNGGTDIGIDNLSMSVMPKKDAGVTAIEFNRCSPVFGRVVIEVSNFGSETIQNFPVEYTIGGNTYTDIFPIRLDRFQKAKFEFATPFNVSAVTSVNITAKTNLTGDAVPANDSKTVTLNVSNFAGIPASGVFEEKFDSGIPANWRVEGKLNTPSWFSAVPNDLLPANVPANADEFPFNPFQLSVFDGNGNGFSGRFVALDDNKGGAARTFDADRLISPSFDLTNHTNIQLSFGSFNSNLIAGGQGDLFVEYSLDNGQSWTQIDRILGDGGGGPAQIIKTYTNLGVLAGKPNVRFAFKYNDKGVISGGAAIDNFRLAGQLVANPIARVEVPTVRRNFVNKGTDAHVVYRFVVEAKDADVVLSDVILKTSNQEYKIEDFKPNSFRLFASVDSTLSASDRNLATLPVVGENKEIQMGCINYGIPRTQKHHFFFTVDVADNAIVPDSISVSLPTISQNLFTILGIRDSSGIAPQRGGYQIIVNPNTPPTSEKIVFEMKMKTVVGDPNLAFKPEDFKFKDVDAPVLELNKLNKLRISTINTRTGAKFQLNGTDITTNQEIAVGDISKMLFIPRLNDAGLNYTTFTFKVFDGRDWSTNDYTAVINVINDKIFIPTLFSPNGDGANDYFMVRGGEGTIDKISFKIVDRNNNPMYDSSNLTEITTIGWDGKKDGKEQPAGTYMWYIEGTYKDGKPLEFNGKKTGVIRLVR